MKKTYLTMILALTVLATVLTACGKPVKTNETTEETEVKVVETTETVVEETTETSEDKKVEEISETDTVEKTEVTENQQAKSVVNSLTEINDVCATKATCEANSRACVVDVSEDSANPYDVIYDYGEDYQAYVDACDWTLVFDAEYYKKTFPMLALQYHNDDALLLKHFQTVGIHEGRQGSAKFNITAYLTNCAQEVYDAFGTNYAAYYIYFMMNNETESTVNVVTTNNGDPVYQQMACVYTALQLMEYEKDNQYHVAANAGEIVMNAELNAFANYRAYLNAHDGYVAHDWAINNDPAIAAALKAMGSTNGRYAENTVTQDNSIPQAYYDCYANSPEHYDTMINPDFNTVGCSNLYWNMTKARGSQFDVYAYNLNTAI